MKDYYNTLELERNASQEEIAWAYSRLALKFHPKRNEQKDFTYNNYKFAEIAEAYEVLSTCKIITIFNKYELYFNFFL